MVVDFSHHSGLLQIVFPEARTVAARLSVNQSLKWHGGTSSAMAKRASPDSVPERLHKVCEFWGQSSWGAI